MLSFRISNESSSRIVFVAGPSESSYPDPKKYRYNYLYVVKFSDSDGPRVDGFDRELPLVVGYKADDKVRGGGVYPITWRRIQCLSVPDGLSKPVSDEDLRPVYEEVRSLFPQSTLSAD